MGYDLHFQLYGSTKQDIGGLLEAVATELSPEYEIKGRVWHRLDNILEKRDPHFIKGKLKEVAERSSNNDEHISFRFGSVNFERRPYGIEVDIRGSEGWEGAVQSITGPLKFNVAFEQFYHREVTMLADVKEPPKSWDELIPKKPVGYDYDAIYRTFGRLVGLNTDWLRPFGVEHSLAYANFADTQEAQMVYHVNIDGFVKDFEVMRHRYWKGSTSAMLYSDDLRMPDEEFMSVGSTRRLDFDPISERIDIGHVAEYPNHSREELHAFFQRIDEDVIAHFRSLSSEELQLLVELAAEETGRRWLPAAAGDGGAVVGSLQDHKNRTLRFLIDFYEYLLDYYDQQTG